jgi:hypothetical protein
MSWEDAQRDQRKARVPQPTHTPAIAPKSAHLRVVMNSAACSTYHRLSSARCGGSASSEGFTNRESQASTSALTVDEPVTVKSEG